MATNQTMREGILEGDLVIWYKAVEAMEVGDVVELHPTSAGYVRKCGTSGTPFGFCAQEVTAAGVPDYYPGGLVSHTGKVGDYVGVYIRGGVYWTKDATDAAACAEVYAGTTTAGKLSASASSTAIKVGLVLVAKDTDTGLAKVKSYL